ncbi:MAG: hypothetical protein WCO93_03650 [bacterium]
MKGLVESFQPLVVTCFTLNDDLSLHIDIRTMYIAFNPEFFPEKFPEQWMQQRRLGIFIAFASQVFPE